MAENDTSDNSHGAQQPLDLTLARAAAAFKDADFFESSILFWSAALELPFSTETENSLAILASGLDLEQELGLDVQREDPIDLVFPATAPTTKTADSCFAVIDDDTISPIQTYVLTALCYLARHINVRIDILPSGQDTLTSLGPPQRYFLSLSREQKQTYHAMLAIIFATVTSISSKSRRESAHESHEQLTAWEQQQQILQTTLLGNTATSATWQTVLTQKRTPHNLPRFFSFMNTSSCTVAGCSIPRNEADIDALEQAGFRLVITLIKESPLSVSWFYRQQKGEPRTKRIRNAFVPIENRKAPAFPEVFEVLMGWCVIAGYPEMEGQTDEGASLSIHHHQRATVIHCGGGKGRAGIMLAAHLIRFGLLGHEGRGYCTECIRNGNVHRYDLDQFRKGLGDQGSAAATIPTACNSIAEEVDSDEEIENKEYLVALEKFYHPVRRSECLNRYQPMMTAKDAMAHLRELRPGSIETVEQEKAVKAYGDWLWKRSSSKFARSRTKTSEDPSLPLSSFSTSTCDGVVSEQAKNKKDAKKVQTQTQKQSKPAPAPAPVPAPVVENEGDEFSDDDFGRGGRKSGKKGKKNFKKMPQEPPRVFVPPPADKIIKIEGSHHHQHHLVVQHNMRARQLQRGQKSKKNGGGGKQSKERPSYNVSGSPLASAPKLIILAGLPGSGKSHLVTTLLQDFPEHFVRISQDELGSRGVCERLLAQSMRHQQQSLAVRGPKKALPMTIFVDRCNPTIAERKEWYEVAFQPDEVAMVWFSQSVDQCIERVDSRENHPTVAPGMGSKVVKSFAKSFEFPNLAKEGSWCKTLVEVGDDEGSDRLLEVMRRFAKEVPASSGGRTASASGGEAKQVKARPAFIPARALQRKSNSAIASSGESGFDTATSHSKLPPSGSMASVEEEEEEEDEEEEDENTGSEGEDEDYVDTEDEDVEDEGLVAEQEKAVIQPEPASSITKPVPAPPSNLSITKALQFASLTGHRPAVKKPSKLGWKGAVDATIDTATLKEESSPTALLQELASPKGVSFATPLTNYDRPLQKFPRTPHLFDPLTIRKSLEQRSDCLSAKNSTSGAKSLESSPSTSERSAAISRSDLLLPPSALHQVFSPKTHQVLTVEEKMDGANIGFSVLHFKTMNGFAGISGAGPPPKIRIQNRNHFVHPDDHWQFKKLGSWLDRHREDILYLCEGRWRFETRNSRGQGTDSRADESDDSGQDSEDEQDETNTMAEVAEDDGDEAWADEDDEGDENEYVDEDKVLQDGLAPYVLYGEWLYAKHSVQYTGLKSWFVPFDLYDMKTGTFVSRELFRRAVSKTQLTCSPAIEIPKEVVGDVDRALDWTLEMLQSRSALMKRGKNDNGQSDLQHRVEGLYFRIDQGDRLLMRSKVVRPDFIAGEERWGAKEQLSNQLVPYEETLPDYDNQVYDDEE